MDTTVDFRQITAEDRALYESHLPDGYVRGCEFSFANVYLWGRQKLALLHDQIVLFACFGKYCGYPWPIGRGDKKAVLDAVIADAKKKGIVCRISGLDAAARETLDKLYPGLFRYECSDGSFDYVYDINDLAELAGKKYHGKRNHIHRFLDAHPGCTVEPLSEDNLPRVMAMTEEWYRAKLAGNPGGDYRMEQAALERAFRDYRALGMDGLVLLDGDTVLAMTLGSRLSADTFDVQFEKARPDAEGAYAMINREFARYIQTKYPDIRYLDREEDMGIDGLRRAKRSYHPHHMIEKCRAVLINDSHAN